MAYDLEFYVESMTEGSAIAPRPMIPSDLVASSMTLGTFFFYLEPLPAFNATVLPRLYVSCCK